MAFRSHIEDMRTAFSLLDSAVASVNVRTEGGNSLDLIRVKAVFYALLLLATMLPADGQQTAL